jgi:hypothetical protein
MGGGFRKKSNLSEMKYFAPYAFYYNVHYFNNEPIKIKLSFLGRSESRKI